jgi:hypothetical protein
MTRRTWDTNDGWECAAGWDRPLQHFFFDIQRQCRNCDGQGGFSDEPNDADQCPVCEGQGIEYLFNNLMDEEGLADAMGGMKLEQVQLALGRYLTEWPEGLVGALILDELGNIGNLEVRLGVYGEERKSGTII